MCAPVLVAIFVAWMWVGILIVNVITSTSILKTGDSFTLYSDDISQSASSVIIVHKNGAITCTQFYQVANSLPWTTDMFTNLSIKTDDYL